MVNIANDEFFGLFLLNKKYFSYPALYKSYLLQKRLNKKMGDWALELGYLSKEQVDSIYDEQKRTNNYFGEIAIKKGVLTEKAVQSIIQMQQESHTFIGEIFKLLGYINDEDLNRELEEYKKIEEQRIKKVTEFVNENTKDYKYLDLILNAAEHTVYRMMIISLKISSDIQKTKKIIKKSRLYKVEFTGDLNFSIYFNYEKNFCDDAVYNFFNNYPRKKVLTMQESILQELSNIVSGVIATDLSNIKDVSVNISIPKRIDEPEVVFENYIIQAPLLSPDGLLQLNIVKN